MYLSANERSCKQSVILNTTIIRRMPMNSIKLDRVVYIIYGQAILNAN